MIEGEKRSYFERVRLREKRILEGRGDLNSLFLDYILKNITPDIVSLPFI